MLFPFRKFQQKKPIDDLLGKNESFRFVDVRRKLQLYRDNEHQLTPVCFRPGNSSLRREPEATAYSRENAIFAGSRGIVLSTRLHYLVKTRPSEYRRPPWKKDGNTVHAAVLLKY